MFWNEYRASWRNAWWLSLLLIFNVFVMIGLSKLSLKVAVNIDEYYGLALRGNAVIIALGTFYLILLKQFTYPTDVFHEVRRISRHFPAIYNMLVGVFWAGMSTFVSALILLCVPMNEPSSVLALKGMVMVFLPLLTLGQLFRVLELFVRPHMAMAIILMVCITISGMPPYSKILIYLAMLFSYPEGAIYSNGYFFRETALLMGVNLFLGFLYIKRYSTCHINEREVVRR